MATGFKRLQAEWDELEDEVVALRTGVGIPEIELLERYRALQVRLVAMSEV